MVANRDEWLKLEQVKLRSGDILIKRVWTKSDGAERNRGVVEVAIRVAASTHRHDKLGSPYAEHAAMVGACGGAPRIIEADEDGIALKSEEKTQHLGEENSYLVFGFEARSSQESLLMRLLCDGMATRLAQIQGENPVAVLLNYYPGVPENSEIWRAVQSAHECRDQPKKQSYATLNTVYSVLPNLIPDVRPQWMPQFCESAFSMHDQRVLDFIEGSRPKISYICSGLVASLLQAWIIGTGRPRVFKDPAQIHPIGLEHKFLNNEFPRIVLRGRWGSLDLNNQLAKDLMEIVDAASHAYQNQFNGDVKAIGFGPLKIGGHRRSTGIKRVQKLKTNIRSAETILARLTALENFFAGDGSYKRGSLKRHVAEELFRKQLPERLFDGLTDIQVERKVAQLMVYLRGNSVL